MNVSSRILARKAFIGAILLAHACAFAQTAGMVKTVTGEVNIERNGLSTAAKLGSTVESGDRIVTGATGAVGVALRDNTLLSAGPRSVLVLNRFAFDSTTHAGSLDASIKRGTLAVISGKLAKSNPENVVFSTPNTTLGVRGTEFVVEILSAQDL